MTYRSSLVRYFALPLMVLVGIGLYGLLHSFNLDSLALIVGIVVVVCGSYPLLKETALEVVKGHFALDYIALLAIGTALFMGEFFVAQVIALMLASGRTLESYGVRQAKESLTALVSRIPSEVLRWEKGRVSQGSPINKVRIGQEIFIRKGEVIPLDGILVSEGGITDESSLTGEPYVMEKISGDQIRSGTVNVGEAMVVKVMKAEKDSTYRKIIEMVKKAQDEKAPLVRLADNYSALFTIITLAIAGAAYYFTRDVERVLSILVIATPCPLILATPIALMGGMNAAAKKRIIIKNLASIEVLSRVNAMIFDKTGTITFGTPTLTRVEVIPLTHTEHDVLSIAAAIERSSLHPFAKAIIEYAKSKHAPVLHAQEVREKIGVGISGTIEGARFTMRRLKDESALGIEMVEGDRRIAVFHFSDTIKRESKAIVRKLRDRAMEIFVYTGDKRAAAEKIAKELAVDLTIKAECTPEDKTHGIHELKKMGKITAMVGDGINDAPALALADVGMVFSNEEQTAASEAADIVFLGGDFALVLDAVTIAKRTVRIALQSILWGIGLSVTGMLFAAGGFVPAIVGAFIQEAIDVTVILNALRASRLPR